MSYTYLIIFDFHKTRKFESYLIPNNEISHENRLALQQMQVYGNLDADKEQKKSLSKEEILEQNLIILYLFQASQIHLEDDRDFITSRSENYNIFHGEEFTELSKWIKYKRRSNWNVDHSITHVYELIDNTYE